MRFKSWRTSFRLSPLCYTTGPKTTFLSTEPTGSLALSLSVCALSLRLTLSFSGELCNKKKLISKIDGGNAGAEPLIQLNWQWKTCTKISRQLLERSVNLRYLYICMHLRASVSFSALQTLTYFCDWISLFTNCTKRLRLCTSSLIERCFRQCFRTEHLPLASPAERGRRRTGLSCGRENSARRRPTCNRRGRHGSATIGLPIRGWCRNRPRWANTANSLAATSKRSRPNPTIVVPPQRC